MTEPATELFPDDLPPPTPDADAADAETTVWERRLELMLAPEWQAHLQRAVGTLPPGEVLEIYRASFGPGDDRQSLPLVRVSLRKLTQQAVVTHLPRIATDRPDIAKYLASHWLEKHDAVLTALTGDGPLPDATPVDVLELAHLLLGEDSADTEERSALTAALEQARRSQTDCAHWQERHAEALADSARLRRDVEHLTDRLKRAEQRTDAAVKQEREQGTKQLDKALRKAQHRIDAAERDLSEAQTQIAIERGQWRRDKEALERRASAAASERSIQLSATLARERADNERARARHTEQLRDLHREIQGLKEELAARDAEAETPFDDDLLDDALVIAYSGIADEPAARLTGLFELYGAFLAGRRTDERLTRHSNVSQFKGRQPAGILLLDLQQLLLDGVNLPLGRDLTARGLRQEAVLHQLISRAESPRLGKTT